MLAAYVLHARAFSDTSLLLECLTQQHGLIPLLAKGAKRPRSRWHGILQPFFLLQVAWVGRSEIKTLTQAEIEAICPMKGRKIMLGLYLNELLIRLLHRMDPHPKLFDNYHHALCELSKNEDEFIQQTILRRFELNLLTELGYGLDLTQEATHHAPILADVLYSYDPSLGILEVGGGPPSQQMVVSGACIIALREGKFEEKEMKEAKKLIRFIFTHYLGKKPLYSRQLFHLIQDEKQK